MVISNPVTSEKRLHFETLDIFKFRILWLFGASAGSHFIIFFQHRDSHETAWVKNKFRVELSLQGDLSYSNHGKQNFFPNFWSSNTKFKQRLKRYRLVVSLKQKTTLRSTPWLFTQFDWVIYPSHWSGWVKHIISALYFALLLPWCHVRYFTSWSTNEHQVTRPESNSPKNPIRIRCRVTVFEVVNTPGAHSAPKHYWHVARHERFSDSQKVGAW